MHSCKSPRNSMNVPSGVGAPKTFETQSPVARKDDFGRPGSPHAKREAATTHRVRDTNSHRRAVGAVVVIIILVAVIYVGYSHGTTSAPPLGSTASTALVGSTTSVTLVGSATSAWLSDPSFQGSKTNITYPPSYTQLANYTLGLINQDRTSNGIPPVSLSTAQSGQQHADSLAYFGTIGHWDVQGYKPYMRYTLLGGTGSVSENVGPTYCTNSQTPSASVFPTPCTIQTLENAIANSEYQMMNNDSACCNNGHRLNILNRMHNAVSIGIAYNATSNLAYLVEDFEDTYITSESLQLSAGTITFQGSTAQNLQGWTSTSSGATIVMYYDPPPSNISISMLVPNPSCYQYNEFNEPPSCQYQGAYTPGTEISSVFAPCPNGYTCQSGNDYAQVWQQDSAGSFEIVFSISAMESAQGSGVYTLYLFPLGQSEPITSLSLFVATG